MSALVKVVGTAAQLAARNPVVPRGILAVAYDTGAVKVGDGVTTYNALTALSGGGGGSADKLGLTYYRPGRPK